MPPDSTVNHTTLPAHQYIAQHNALVNGSYSLLPLQKRLFIALLARITFDDLEFKECLIPTAELISGSTETSHPGGSSYYGVAAMCKGITGIQLQVEAFEDERRQRQRTPVFTTINLMRLATYNSKQGGVLARFHEDMRPYLLQLHQCGHYTRVNLAEIRKLQSPYALRIYWLLKEYGAFGQRTIALDMLKFMLGLQPTEYQKLDHFRKRVLDRAQQELTQTDLPFTYELQREGRLVKGIKVVFPRKAVKAEQAVVVDPEESWALQLLRLDVSRRTILVVDQQLAAGVYTTGYIRYVLARVAHLIERQVSTNSAGLIAKALREAWWLDDFKSPPS